MDTATADFYTALSAWGAVGTAVATGVLAGGVVVAMVQLREQQTARRLIATPDVLKGWSDAFLRGWRARLDSYADVQRNIARVRRIWDYSARPLPARRQMRDEFKAFIHQSSRVAEQIEVFVRHGAADEGIVAEHVGYGIVMLYVVLHDILQELADKQGEDFEGWRQLAIRCQIYAKLNPGRTNLIDELVWVKLSPIRYRHRRSREQTLPPWIWLRLRFVQKYTMHDPWRQPRP